MAASEALLDVGVRAGDHVGQLMRYVDELGDEFVRGALVAFEWRKG